MMYVFLGWSQANMLHCISLTCGKLCILCAFYKLRSSGGVCTFLCRSQASMLSHYKLHTGYTDTCVYFSWACAYTQWNLWWRTLPIKATIQKTSIIIQWNLSIMDTLGTTWSVLIQEVSLFQRLFCTLFYVAGTTGSVLIREASLFWRSLIERFHCILLRTQFLVPNYTFNEKSSLLRKIKDKMCWS